MASLVVPLNSPEATDAARFGAKASQLAALGQAGLPTPGGYAVDARAYRAQLAALGLEATARAVFAVDDRPLARRMAARNRARVDAEYRALTVLRSLSGMYRRILAGAPVLQT